MGSTSNFIVNSFLAFCKTTLTCGWERVWLCQFMRGKSDCT